MLSDSNPSWSPMIPLIPRKKWGKSIPTNFLTTVFFCSMVVSMSFAWCFVSFVSMFFHGFFHVLTCFFSMFYHVSFHVLPGFFHVFPWFVHVFPCFFHGLSQFNRSIFFCPPEDGTLVMKSGESDVGWSKWKKMYKHKHNIVYLIYICISIYKYIIIYNNMYRYTY